jgi:hypothetical protein
MGMYSYTEYCDLKIKDGKKGEFLKWLDGHERYKDVVKIDGDNVEIDVDVGWKIISYWYDEFLDELEELNEFLIGKWCLIFETHDQMAIIEFGKEVKISLGTMEFVDYGIEDFRILNEEMEKALKKIWA